MGATTNFKLPWPELGNLADGPDGYEDLAEAVEAALIGQRDDSTDTKVYTPTWRSAGNLQPSGMAWTARYLVRNGWCQVQMYGAMSASTNGGTEWFLVGLPVRSRAGLPEQLLNCKLSIPGGNFSGWAYFPASSLECIPYFPISASRTDMAGWKSCDNSKVPGTGTPQIPGQHAVGPGNVSIWGRYMV